MTNLLQQPFLTMVGADASSAEVPPASEILIARVSAMVYAVVSRAPQAAVIRAAASGSNVGLMHALADMVVTEAPADDAWTTALLQGSVALAACLEAAGGVWTADEATTRLKVKRQTLQQWRDKAGEPMTPFTALARGDASRVLDLVRWVVTRPDADAPDVATEAHAIATA